MKGRREAGAHPIKQARQVTHNVYDPQECVSTHRHALQKVPNDAEKGTHLVTLLLSTLVSLLAPLFTLTRNILPQPLFPLNLLQQPAQFAAHRRPITQRSRSCGNCDEGKSPVTEPPTRAAFKVSGLNDPVSTAA